MDNHKTPGADPELAQAEVTAFCMWPGKSTSMAPKVDVIVVYTGDGRRLIDAAIRHAAAHPQAKILILGAHSMMASELDGWLTADHFRDAMIAAGIDPSRIMADASQVADSTHGQAIRAAMWFQAAVSWETAILVTSQHHCVRSFMTTLGVFLREGLGWIRILPEPDYRFGFAEHPAEWKERWRALTPWQCLADDGLPKVKAYRKNFPQNMASWEDAQQYIRRITGIL